MEEERRREMFAYYDEGAGEYDRLYAGKSASSVLEPGAYVNDAKAIAEMACAFGAGHVVDIGCGTAYWLPYYARNCDKISLFDQAPAMLRQARRRAETLGILGKCCLVQGDLFEHAFGNDAFDSAVAAFVISHLACEEERVFFAKLRHALKAGGAFLMIDSVWNEARSEVRCKVGYQQRQLSDGRTFSIFKRYFDGRDVEDLFRRHRFGLVSWYTGGAFFAVVGRKQAQEDGSQRPGSVPFFRER